MKEVDTNQITIDEVIAEETQDEQAQRPKDPCADCSNHTCDWGTCYMADKK